MYFAFCFLFYFITLAFAVALIEVALLKVDFRPLLIFKLFSSDTY